MQQLATTYGPLAAEVAFTLVSLILLSLRSAISNALTSWAGSQTEQKDASRILKLKTIVDDGLATVETNILAELEKDTRTALADGKIDGDERQALRDKIAGYARTTLADHGLEAAKEVYAVAEDKLDDWLANRVEGRVASAVVRS